MKNRRLTAIVAALCLMICFLLAGCGADEFGLEAAQKDPQTYLQQAVERTAEQTSVDTESDIRKLLQGLSEKGKLTLRLQDMDGVDVDAVIAYDRAAQAVSGTAAVSAEGVRLNLNLWGNADALAFAVPEIWDETAYGLSWAMLSEDLSKSAIWSMIGISYGDIVEELTPMLEQIKQALADKKTDVSTDVIEKLESILKEVEYTVAEEGDNAVCVGFAVTKEQTRAMVDAMLDGEVGDLLAALGNIDDGEEIAEQVREILTALCGEAKFEVVIDNENGFITAVTAECAIIDETEGECRVNFALDMTDLKDISLTVGARSGDEAEETVTLRLRNQDTQDSLTRLLTLSAEHTEISVLLTYKDETLALTCSSECAVVFGIDAHLTLSEDALELSDIRVVGNTFGTETLPLQIGLSTQAQVEQMPAYTNLLTMSETETMKMIQALMEYMGGKIAY